MKKLVLTIVTLLAINVYAEEAAAPAETAPATVEAKAIMQCVVPGGAIEGAFIYTVGAPKDGGQTVGIQLIKSEDERQNYVGTASEEAVKNLSLFAVVGNDQTSAIEGVILNAGLLITSPTEAILSIDNVVFQMQCEAL